MIFFRQKSVLWELGWATRGPLTTSQDAAGNVTTSFLPDMQAEQAEAMRNVGLGSCFSLEAIPAPNDVNKAGTVPPFLVSPSLGCWLAQWDHSVLESQLEQAVSVNLEG